MEKIIIKTLIYNILIVLLGKIVISNPKVDKLGNSNGVVPFKIGHGYVLDNYHVFAHYINLNDIFQISTETTDTFNSLKTNLNISEFIIEQGLIKHKIMKISNNFKQINLNIRFRRGLINGLGFVVKQISGNLDNDDAIKYDTAINELKTNQKDISLTLNKQVSLNKLILDKMNNTYNNLIQHTNKMNSLIEQINNETNLLSRKLVVKMILDNIYFQLLEIEQQLNKIIDTITLSRNNIVNEQLIDLIDLHNMVKIIREIYPSSTIISFRELHSYYQFLNIKVFQIGTNINILIEFPLTTGKQYDFIEVLAIPNINKMILIPETHYVLFESEEIQLGTDVNCLKVEEQYLCKSHNLEQLKCNLWKIDNNCVYIKLGTISNMVEKLNENSLLIVPNQNVKIEYYCSNNRNLYNFKEPSILHIDLGCYVKYNGQIFLGNSSNFIKPLDIEVLQLQNTTNIIDTNIQLSKIKNQDFHELYQKAENIKQLNLDKKHIQYQMYSIPVIFIMLLFFCVILFIYRIKRVKTSVCKQMEPLVVHYNKSAPF